MKQPVIRQTKIQGKTCYIVEKGIPRTLLYWGVGAKAAKEVEEVASFLAAQDSCKDFLLAAYEAEDWNREYSPWQAPAVYKEEFFAGEGGKTLQWLQEECVPFVQQYGKEAYALEGNMLQQFLLGYSLAGLFSLWAFYEQDGRMFQGTACCSGSLWFPGWDAYLMGHRPPKDSAVYLSLGKKEEKTKHKVMCRVGDVTRLQYERLCADENVKRCELCWQEGGHFQQPQMRLAQAVQWLLSK